MSDLRKNHFGREYLVERFIALKFSPLILLLLTSACTTTIVDDRAAPAEVEERIVVDGQVLPYPDEGAIKPEVLEGTDGMSDVVKDLLDTAADQKLQQDYDAATSSLERALRIEPRNAAVWHELADLKLSKENYKQAIQFAQKSNALVKKAESELQRRNWYLISVAYSALGDENKATQYRQKLE
ncbi:MAG: tetratricopeptide repeat protein [Pseudomonadota bacterium]